MRHGTPVSDLLGVIRPSVVYENWHLDHTMLDSVTDELDAMESVMRTLRVFGYLTPTTKGHVE